MTRHRGSPWLAFALVAAALSVGGAAAADDAPAGSSAPVASAAPEAPPPAEPPAASADPAAPPAPDALRPAAKVAAPDPGKKPDAPARRTMRRARKNARLEIHARDLRLDTEAMDRLERIAARYHEKTRTRLVITGGMRPAQVQAKLMYAKLAHGDDILKLYENTAAAREIRATYRDGVTRKLPRSVQIRRIRDTIQAQLARGVYVSKHLSAVAADVRSRGMTPAQERALRAAVAAEPGVEIVDERGSAEPHFHLDLLATPPGPPPTETTR